MLAMHGNPSERHGYTAPMSPAPKPAPLSATLTYRLHRLHKLTDRASAALYQAELGLALGEARCLAAIGSFAPLSVMDLAWHANLDKGQASRAAQTLVSHGWVVKQPSPTDGRGVVLGLTPAGRSLHRRLLGLVQARNRRIAQCLSADERRAFGAMLDRLVSAAAADAGDSRDDGDGK
jgi:DNA-binding MarR family transcriptional regulator